MFYLIDSGRGSPYNGGPWRKLLHSYITTDKFKMSDLYEVRKIEGKGYGCFALKNIKKGTLILQEIQKHVWLDLQL